MTRYQMFLAGVLVLWPVAIIAVLFFMERIERYVARSEAGSPQEAGLEPVAERRPDREVRIFLGDRPVTTPE